jgi:hypothetical protein
MVGTGRFELPTPRTPSECSTRLSHVPTRPIKPKPGFLGTRDPLPRGNAGLTVSILHQEPRPGDGDPSFHRL